YSVDMTYILTGRRGQGRWEANRTILAHGGIVDPGEDPYETAVRELQEEVPGMKVEVDRLPFLLTPSHGMRYRWNPEARKAELTEDRAQDVPITTIEYWGEWVSGEPEATGEAHNLRWTPVTEIIHQENDWAFNMALIIPKLIDCFF
ncbi:MAG: NUDIX domain-containing protein, partial [Patescibacteria group bacterium]